MDHLADVIVIGAGVVGSSIALELARGGRRVLVVDRGPGPGFGSTSASSAMVRFNYSTFAGVAAAWESKLRWDAWEEHLGFADPDGLARLHTTGMACVNIAPQPLDGLLDRYDRLGIAYEHWDAATLAARIPGIDVGSWFPPVPVTSDAFLADPRGEITALYTPDAGHVDDPRLAAANLAAAARHLGAAFRFRCRVAGLERAGSRWRVVTDSGDALESAVVVNAAGPWSGALNRLAGADADFAVSTRPLRQEVHHIAAPDTGGVPLPSIADLDLGMYLRPDTGGHALVGGTEPECDPLEWLEDPDLADPRVSVERFEAQVHRAARRFPRLGVPRRPQGIVGVYDVASDWTPIYDRTALPGFYVAVGTSGNQFKNAPVIGSLMTAIIDAVEAGRDHDADPVIWTGTRTGATIDLGAFSRLRAPTSSSGTVLG